MFGLKLIKQSVLTNLEAQIQGLQTRLTDACALVRQRESRIKELELRVAELEAKGSEPQNSVQVPAQEVLEVVCTKSVVLKETTEKTDTPKKTVRRRRKVVTKE